MYSTKNEKLPEKRPLLSVVIGVYNLLEKQAHYDAFNRCLNSIRRQWFNDEVEISAADFGSDDGTIGMLRKLQEIELIDSVYPSPYKDIYYALNKAAEDFTCGKYITFIHYDDFYHDEFAFCDFIKAMLNANLDFLSYQSKYYSQESDEIDIKADYEKENVLWKYSECDQGLFFKREVFLRERFDLRYLWGQDYEIMLRMGLKGYRCGNLEKPYKSVDFERAAKIAREAEAENPESAESAV